MILPRLLAGALLLWAAPTKALAQEAADGAGTRTLCFSGAPSTLCSNFLILEMGATIPIQRGTRLVRWPGDPETREAVHEKQIEWHLGLMHNLAESWAVGATVGLGTGSTAAITTALARVRWWAARNVGVELLGGRIFRNPVRPGPRPCEPAPLSGACISRQGRVSGWRVGARADLNDDVYAGLGVERLSLEVYEDALRSDSGGDVDALSLFLGTGSEWTIAGTAALAAGALFVFILPN